jgi:hypothetical protein
MVTLLKRSDRLSRMTDRKNDEGFDPERVEHIKV